MARILIVDDDADMRAMLQDTLRNAGYEVVSAADGKEALKLHRKEAADLVITDLFMPNKDGFETINDLRKESPRTLLIAICGRPPAMQLLPLAQRLGAADVLQKPFAADDLLKAVRRVLSAESPTPS